MLSWLGVVLHAPNLWHLNRDSVSRALALGLFWAWIPMPFQMIPAAICAIPLRANIGLSVATVWISNPLTMGPIFYASYRVGRILLGMGPPDLSFQFNYRSVAQNLSQIWEPLYAGSVACGILVGFAAYLTVQLLWRWNLRRRWKMRGLRRRRRATV